jgi:hypothetical protein
MKTLEERITQIEDENAIRALTYKYADAANRIDADLFKSLWVENSEWIIGPPINQKFIGRDQIVGAFVGLLHSWDFFVQQPVGGNLEINGTTAKAHFYVNEIARSKDGVGNYNLSQYEDELEKLDGVWFFVKRNYKVIYLDQSPLNGTSFKL